MNMPRFVYPLTGCFHFLAIMNIYVQAIMWTYDFSSLGQIPRNDYAVSYGKLYLIF